MGRPGSDDDNDDEQQPKAACRKSKLADVEKTVPYELEEENTMVERQDARICDQGLQREKEAPRCRKPQARESSVAERERARRSGRVRLEAQRISELGHPPITWPSPTSGL
ncbi:hypothetical protein ACG7TL_008326 [Trametes sanguinea]